MLDSIETVTVPGMTLNRLHLLLAFRHFDENAKSVPWFVCTIDNITWLRDKGFIFNGDMGYGRRLTTKGEKFIADLEKYIREWGMA